MRRRSLDRETARRGFALGVALTLASCTSSPDEVPCGPLDDVLEPAP